MWTHRFWDVPFILCSLLLLVFFCVFMANANVAAEGPAKITTVETETPAPQYAEQQLEVMATEINKIRVEKGLDPLEQSAQLDKIADERAGDMSARAYYAHKNPDGLYFFDLMKNQGVDGGYACENLNMDEVFSPNSFIQAWMDSNTGHKECILNSDIAHAGYAITKVLISNGIPVNQYVVVAIYTQ